MTDEQRKAAQAEEELPYIDDRASKVWVLALVGIFVLILAYGLLFGHGGMLSPATPSPAPSPTPSPTLSASPRPSTSATPAGTQHSGPPLTPAPSVTATPAASPT